MHMGIGIFEKRSCTKRNIPPYIIEVTLQGGRTWDRL
jgi:hypothetical protein